jgi:hypothetical protein
VTFPSGKLTLHGVLHKPDGPGPFPAVVYNHGSGRNYARQFAALGPLYASHGREFLRRDSGGAGGRAQDGLLRRRGFGRRTLTWSGSPEIRERLIAAVRVPGFSGLPVSTSSY